MAEPWIRVHAGLVHKPVVGRVVAALGVSHHEAVGLMVCFWSGVSQFARRGDLSTIPDGSIETWAGWPIRRGQRRGAFAEFIRAQHVDESNRVREWDKYAGRLDDRRERDESPDRKSTYVYYAVDGDECKIGWSGNPWARVAELRTARPRIRLVATEKGARALEYQRHSEFTDDLIEREWFRLTPCLARHIKSLIVEETVVNDVATTESTTELLRSDSVASRGTKRNDTRREELVSVSALAIRFAAAANRGLAEHPHRPQLIPRIIATDGRTHTATEVIRDAGVPADFAEAEIYRLAKRHDAEGEVSSLKYFAPGVIRAWVRQKAASDRNGFAPPSDPVHPVHPKNTANGRRDLGGARNDAALERWLAKGDEPADAEVSDMPDVTDDEEVHHGE